MTAIRTHEMPRRMGRTKLWTERLTLPLDDATLTRLKAVQEEGEDRLSVIRAGIELELQRRERLARRKRPDA